MDEGGLFVLEALGALARQAEVRVLVDGAGDQARDVGLVAKDLRERVGEGRGRLDRDKVPLADVVAARERARWDERSVSEEGRGDCSSERVAHSSLKPNVCWLWRAVIKREILTTLR